MNVSNESAPPAVRQSEVVTPSQKPVSPEQVREMDAITATKVEAYKILAKEVTTTHKFLAKKESQILAVINDINKIVFIHGVGNGVLRQSIRDILKRYDGIEYSDGSYQKYGAGATEVRIISRNKAK